MEMELLEQANCGPLSHRENERIHERDACLSLSRGSERGKEGVFIIFSLCMSLHSVLVRQYIYVLTLCLRMF